MILFAVGITMALGGSVAGDFLVKQGVAKVTAPDIKSFGGIAALLNPLKLFEFVKQSHIFNNKKLMFGIFLLAIHFAGYLLAMREAPVTLVVPLMSLTYIIDTVLAKLLLRERVTWLRWGGVAVVMVGVIGLTTFGGFQG